MTSRTRQTGDRLHWMVLRGGLTLLAAGGALAIPAQLWAALRATDLSWDGEVGYSSELTQDMITPADGVSLTFDGHVRVFFDDPSTRLSLLSAAPGIVLAAAISYVAWVLLLVVLNVNAGQPFYGAIPRLLATLAPVIAVAAVAITFLRAQANREIMSAALAPERYGVGPGDLFRPDINAMIAWLFVALFVGVIARVFAEGRRLADDTQGLV